jgi:hypothetical protein
MIKSGEDRSGRQIWIADAANGSACNLVCPHCREPLIAKQGRMIDWHFAHSSGTECARALETALHKMAKQIFAETRALTLPRLDYLYGERFIAFDSVSLEHQDGDMRYDALATSDGRRLAVEFCVHHGVDDVKAEKLKARDISCVEVHLDADDDKILSYLALKDAVQRAAPRKWVSLSEEIRRRIEAARKAYERDPETLLEARIDRLMNDAEQLLDKLRRKFPFGSPVRQAAKAVQELHHARGEMELASRKSEDELAERRLRNAIEFGWQTMKLPRG